MKGVPGRLLEEGAEVRSGEVIHMKILITGGTGFVGTQLTSRLLTEGHEITVLTRSAAVTTE
jgi:short-subunit dehydrogenase involved in D-alanine esterification of teichoic acids